MKKINVFTVSAMLAYFGAAALIAGPPAGGWKQQNSLTTADESSELEGGDKIVQVCRMCNAVSIAEVKSTEDAMEFCKEGAALDCPSCDNVAKVVRTGPKAKGKNEVKFVDDHSEVCMAMSKMDTGPQHHSMPMHQN